MNVWVNGRSAGAFDLRDRGLQYGDGLFETMRVRRHAVRLVDYHLQRLYDGCRRLHIEPPDERRLRRELERAASQRASAVLKLIVTRGVGPRGYRPSGRERCTRILALAPLSRASLQPPDRPIRVRVCRIRLGSNEQLAGMKTLNRLESVLARSEWSDRRIREGLMLDRDGHVVCGTMSNLFLRRGALLVTPLLDHCGVAGVMRRWVLEQAGAAGLRAVEQRIALPELYEADEVFLTNAVAGVMPVGEIRNGTRRHRPASTATAVQLAGLLERL